QRNNLAGNAGMDSFQKYLKEKVLQVRRPDTAAPRPYDNELVPSLSIPSVNKRGLHWTGFKGDFPWVPVVDGLKPAGSGSLKNLNGKMPTTTPHDVLIFEGYVKVPTDGAYNFYLKTNGNAVLKIHEGL